jgi:short-subunit dehydrogenase
VLSGRDTEALEKVATDCAAKGSACTVIPFDLGDEASVRAAADAFFKQFDHIDALYHIGGISQRSRVAETPLEIDRRIMEINFFGTILLTKLVLPAMLRQGHGQIAATSSIVGKFGFPQRSAYSASKHALHGFFESLRAENASNGIKVSMIIPGRIQTNISLNALLGDGKSHGMMDEVLARGLPAGKAARIICHRLAKEKKEIHVGGKELLMVQIRRFFPALYYRMAGKMKV